MSDDMREFYDNPAERSKWGEANVDRGLYPTELHLVKKYCKPGSSVLNVGSGGGREAFALARMGFQVTAVDYTPAFVEACRAGALARGLTIEVGEADATALPYADESFDHVIMVGQLLGHIRGRENRIRALREIRRIARNDSLVSTNAIELRLLFRCYFAALNLGRRIYNPQHLEPDDAFVRRVGGEVAYGSRPIFHWYRTPAFVFDAGQAGWQVVEYLRRYEFEAKLEKGDESGETFYALRKESK